MARPAYSLPVLKQHLREEAERTGRLRPIVKALPPRRRDRLAELIALTPKPGQSIAIDADDGQAFLLNAAPTKADRGRVPPPPDIEPPAAPLPERDIGAELLRERLWGAVLALAPAFGLGLIMGTADPATLLSLVGL